MVLTDIREQHGVLGEMDLILPDLKPALTWTARWMEIQGHYMSTATQQDFSVMNCTACAAELSELFIGCESWKLSRRSTSTAVRWLTVLALYNAKATFVRRVI